MPSGYRGGANNPSLSALWIVDKDQARALCLKVLRYYDGSVRASAEQLKVARSTLTRWVSEDEGLKSGLEVIRQEARRAAEDAAEQELEPDR